MSNALAIATVTQALAILIENNLQPEIDMQVRVRTERPPAEAPDDPTITVFLYQVTPNTSQRNNDLPTRASDGTLVKRPAAALDLHFLISAYGDEAELVGQRLIGCVVRALHEIPVLPKALIEEAAERPYLAGSDLADAIQRVRFTPTQMDVDEASKLWGMLHQTPYALSVVYQAALVLVDGREQPVPAKPVERHTVRVAPFGAPGAPERPPLGAGPAAGRAARGGATAPGTGRAVSGGRRSATGVLPTAAAPESGAEATTASGSAARQLAVRAGRTNAAATAAAGQSGDSTGTPGASAGGSAAGASGGRTRTAGAGRTGRSGAGNRKSRATASADGAGGPGAARADEPGADQDGSGATGSAAAAAPAKKRGSSAKSTASSARTRKSPGGATGGGTTGGKEG